MSAVAEREDGLARWRLVLWAARERLNHAQWLFWARVIRAGEAPRGCRLTAVECVARAAAARRRLAAIKRVLAKEKER